MEFEVVGNNYCSVKSIYISEEESLLCDGNPSSSICIEGTYLTIDIDTRSGLFLGISGFLGDLKKISHIKSPIMQSKRGMLYYKNYFEMEKGVGYNIGYKGKVFLDPKKKTILIIMARQCQGGEWYQVTSIQDLLASLGTGFGSAKLTLFLSESLCILAEHISDGGLTPATDIKLSLTAYRGGSHLPSDITVMLNSGKICMISISI